MTISRAIANFTVGIHAYGILVLGNPPTACGGVAPFDAESLDAPETPHGLPWGDSLTSHEGFVKPPFIRPWYGFIRRYCHIYASSCIYECRDGVPHS